MRRRDRKREGACMLNVMQITCGRRDGRADAWTETGNGRLHSTTSSQRPFDQKAPHAKPDRISFRKSRMRLRMRIWLENLLHQRFEERKIGSSVISYKDSPDGWFLQNVNGLITPQLKKGARQ